MISATNFRKAAQVVVDHDDSDRSVGLGYLKVLKGNKVSAPTLEDS